MEQISASASEKQGTVTVTLANLAPDREEKIRVCGIPVKEAKARVLAGEMREKNDFGHAPLSPKDLPAEVKEDCVLLTLPACSVAELTLK